MFKDVCFNVFQSWGMSLFGERLSRPRVLSCDAVRVFICFGICSDGPLFSSCLACYLWLEDGLLWYLCNVAGFDRYRHGDVTGHLAGLVTVDISCLGVDELTRHA